MRVETWLSFPNQRCRLLHGNEQRFCRPAANGQAANVPVALYGSDGRGYAPKRF
jgi:hypothetical protein